MYVDAYDTYSKAYSDYKTNIDDKQTKVRETVKYFNKLLLFIQYPNVPSIIKMQNTQIHRI